MRVDLAVIRSALAVRAAEVVEHLLGRPNPLRSNRREWRYGTKGSLAVTISRPKAGVWFDHELGVGGDLFDLIRCERGGDFADALNEATRILLGTSPLDRRPEPPQARREASSDDAARTRRAVELWREAVPIVGTIAHRYLLRRGITELPPRISESLRFHRACPFGAGERHPSLLGLMVDPCSNEPRALHRTALTPDGKKIGRKVLGPKSGAVVKLSPDDEVEQGLTIGEGIETVLSGMQLEYRPAWACGDAGNLAAFAVLPGVADGALTILVDHDEAGERAAAVCAQRWVDAGVEVFRVQPKSAAADFNDLVPKEGPLVGTHETDDKVVVRRDQPKRRDEWAEPDWSILDDRRGELPEFPIKVFSAAWQEWLARAAHGAGVTVSHVAVPLIAVASSLIGTARRIQASRSWSQPLTMWTALIGFSGTGKTPGLDVTRRVLRYIERNQKSRIAELRRAHETAAETARSAEKAWKELVRAAVADGTEPPVKPSNAFDRGEFVAPRLYVNDVTIERIAVLLQARARGMLFVRDELAGLFLNLERHSSGSDKEFWLEAWNGEHYVVERMGRPPVEVDHLLVGVTGGFQPDKLARSFEGDDDGLYARFCFAWPPEPDYQKLTDGIAEIEPEIINAFSKLTDLDGGHAEDGGFAPRAIPLSSPAREGFEQFRQFLHGHKDDFDGREREWWAKTTAHVLRLTGTLAYLDWSMRGGKEPEQIGAEFVDAAVQLVRDYFGPHARAALRQVGLSDRHANARRVLRWVRTRGLEVISVKDVRRDALGEKLDAEGTEALLNSLAKRGWLRPLPAPVGPKGGKPARRWEVSPFLYMDMAVAQTAETAETSSSHPVSAVTAVSATPYREKGNDDPEPAVDDAPTAGPSEITEPPRTTFDHAASHDDGLDPPAFLDRRRPDTEPEIEYGGTAAPDPTDPYHAIALKALEGDLPAISKTAVAIINAFQRHGPRMLSDSNVIELAAYVDGGDLALICAAAEGLCAPPAAIADFRRTVAETSASRSIERPSTVHRPSTGTRR